MKKQLNQISSESWLDDSNSRSCDSLGVQNLDKREYIPDQSLREFAPQIPIRVRVLPIFRRKLFDGGDPITG
jgi:hypothetical protein